MRVINIYKGNANNNSEKLFNEGYIFIIKPKTFMSLRHEHIFFLYFYLPLLNWNMVLSLGFCLFINLLSKKRYHLVISHFNTV